MAILAFSAAWSFAQESEAQVVDEVIAQVNDSVITLSQVKREMSEAVDSLVKEGKTQEEARQMVESKRGELIAGIINEELIMQRGKDMGADQDVDAQINQRFLQIMKEQNIKTLEKLYEAMEQTGVNPQEVRDMWRKQIVRDTVMQREVSSKVYVGLAPKELKAYYEANKAKFTKPETITISEIFLGFAGRDMDAVRQKAKDLVNQIRGGADFGKLAAENSDRPNAKETLGKAGTLNVKDLEKTFAEPLKAVKVGGVTEPIEVPEGLEILRVDARENATQESVYDEAEVRKAITIERMPEESKKFMTTLRADAYIKISESYRPIVSPILFADERKAEVKKPDAKKNEK